MALTANRLIKDSIGNQKRQELDATITTLYKGSIMASNPAGTGKLIFGADVAGYVFRGIALEEFPGLDITVDQTITVEDRKVLMALPGNTNTYIVPIVSAVDEKNIGETVYLVGNESVDLIGGVTNNVVAGTIADVIDANTIEMRI